MKEFEYYVKNDKVRSGSSKPSEARSLRVQAKQRFKHRVKDSEITAENSSFIFEDAYEALRQHLQAHMAENGYKPYSHEAIISYSLEKELITSSEANLLDKFRQIRNDIRYRGETVSKERAQKMKELSKSKIFES